MATDFRLVDLDRPETFDRTCRDADVVVSTVRHPALAAERAVLRDGGILLNLDDLPAGERDALRCEIGTTRGLVVDRTGFGGVTGLAATELLDRHPEADALEFGIMVSAVEKAGRAGGLLIRRVLGGGAHLQSVTVELPEPFGRRRCLRNDAAAVELVEPLARGRAARLYVCFLPAAFNALFLLLNALRLASACPRWRSPSGGAAPPPSSVASPPAIGPASPGAAYDWLAAWSSATATTRRRLPRPSPSPTRSSPGGERARPEAESSVSGRGIRIHAD